MTEKPKKTPRVAKSKAKKSTSRQLPTTWILAAGFTALLAIGSFAFFGKHGVLDLAQLQSMLQKLDQENEVMFQQQQDLKSELARLQDPRYLEFLARERLGFMKPQETFIVLDSNKNSTQPQAPREQKGSI